jgi:hypothetical protein
MKEPAESHSTNFIQYDIDLIPTQWHTHASSAATGSGWGWARRRARTCMHARVRKIRISCIAIARSHIDIMQLTIMISV